MAVEIPYTQNQKKRRPGLRERKARNQKRSESPSPPPPHPPTPPSSSHATQLTAKLNIPSPPPSNAQVPSKGGDRKKRSEYRAFLSAVGSLEKQVDRECLVTCVLDDVVNDVLAKAQLGESASPGMTTRFSKPFRDKFKWEGGSLKNVLFQQLQKVMEVAGDYVTDSVRLYHAACLRFAGEKQKRMIRHVTRYGDPQVGMAAFETIKKGKSTELFAMVNPMSLRPSQCDDAAQARDPLSKFVAHQYTFDSICSIKRGIELFMGSGTLRGINHSCDPNAGWRYTKRLITFTNGAGKQERGFLDLLEVFALRDIQPDEEITVYYSNGYFGKENWACKCPDVKHASRPARGTSQAAQLPRRSSVNPKAMAHANHRVDPQGRTRAGRKAAEEANARIEHVPAASQVAILEDPASSNAALATTKAADKFKARQSNVRFSEGKASENIAPPTEKPQGKRGRLSRISAGKAILELAKASEAPVIDRLKAQQAPLGAALAALSTIATNVI